MRVYAFEWCPCIYESAYAMVSLHRTRKKAQEALDRYIAQRQAEHDAAWAEIGERSPFPAMAQEKGQVRKIRVLP